MSYTDPVVNGTGYGMALQRYDKGGKLPTPEANGVTLKSTGEGGYVGSRRTDDAADRAPGGLGIGLTLVRRIAELHGGTVEAFSAGPGEGSEFVVRLPPGGLLPDPRGIRDGRLSGATWRTSHSAW